MEARRDKTKSNETADNVSWVECDARSLSFFILFFISALAQYDLTEGFGALTVFFFFSLHEYLL